MHLIHLLNYILIFLTIFPGIILFIMEKLPKVQRIQSHDKYTIAILAVVFLNGLVFKEVIVISCLMLCLIVPYIFEYIFNEWKSFSMRNMRFEFNSLKQPFFVMVLYPVCEEYIYRFFLYYHISNTIKVPWVFVIISVMSFLFCHFTTQKHKSIYKLPLAIIECIVFLYFNNIFICIIIHMVYNILVYSHNARAYLRNYNS